MHSAEVALILAYLVLGVHLVGLCRVVHTGPVDTDSSLYNVLNLRTSSRRLETAVAATNSSSSSSSSSAAHKASCQLLFRGHAVSPGINAVMTDSVTVNQGLSYASLKCTTNSPGRTVTVAVNSTWITPTMASAFQGVNVVPGLNCQQQLSSRQIPIYGLIYFCGDYELTLDSLNIQGIHIHAPQPTGQADDLVAWQGAVLVFGGKTQATINQASVLNNSAGSPIAVSNNAVVQIAAGSQLGYNKAVWGGVAYLMDNARLTVTGGSMLFNNWAVHSGGAVNCVGGATGVMGGGAVVTGNQARFFGGGLHAAENCQMSVMEGARVEHNKASYGGGTAVKNSGQLTVAGATYEANIAEYGGGVAAQHSGHFYSTARSVFTRNKGKYGGAVAAQNMCNITFTGGSQLVKNTALYGGVVAVQDNAVVVIDGGTTCDSNGDQTSYGGSIAVQNNGQVYVEDSLFINGVGFYGGVVALQNTGQMALGSGAVLRNNTAIFGGVLGAIEETTLVVDNATLEFNSATTGGAIYIINAAVAVIKGGTVISNNTAQYGGGLAATLYCKVTLEDCKFERNYAKGDGGALHLSDTATLRIIPMTSATHNITSPGSASPPTSTAGKSPTSSAHYATVITNNTAADLGGGVSINGNSSFNAAALVAVTHGNRAQYDPDASVPLKEVQVLGPTYIPGIASRFNRTSGTFDVAVKLVGSGGLPCGGRPVQITLQSPQAVQVLGGAKSNASGLVVLSDIKLRERPGNYTLQVSSTTDRNVPPAQIIVEVRHCQLGEVTNELGDACEPCSPGSFSLNPANYSCDACPPHATCPGGAALVPDEGFWHSSVSSPQLHACPNPQACSEDRTTLLSCASGADPNSSSSNASCPPMPSPLLVEYDVASDAYLDLLCASEYSGNLCGNCKPGYGASTAFTCRTCLPKRTATALYISAGVAILLFVRLLTYMTTVDNEASAAASAAAAAAAAQPQAPGQQQQLGGLGLAPNLSGGSGFVSCASEPQPDKPQAVKSTFWGLQQARPLPESIPHPLKDIDLKHNKDVGQQLHQDTPASLGPRGVTPGPNLGPRVTPGPNPGPQVTPGPDPGPQVTLEIGSDQPSPFAAVQEAYEASAVTSGGDGDISMVIAPECSSSMAPADKQGSCSRAMAVGGPAQAPELSLQASADVMDTKFSSGSVAGPPPHAAAAAAVTAAKGGGGAGGPLVNAVPVATSGVFGDASYMARASDVLRDFVLYMQYMVLIGTLRVPWPETLHWPIRALTWFWSASSSETLALECLIDTGAPQTLPIAIARTLFYTGIPLAVFVILLSVEAAVRILMAVVPAVMGWLAAGFRHTGAFHALGRNKRFIWLHRFIMRQAQNHYTWTGSAGFPSGLSLGPDLGTTASSDLCVQLFVQRLRAAFAGFSNTAWVLAGTTIFFFLPSVVRYSLSLFVCVRLDDPDFIPYPWTAATPGTYFLHDLNQECWIGWHKYWALLYGIPLIVLSCVVLPIGIAALVWFNKASLDEPWFKRKYGSLYRIFRPKHAAWGAVVVLQTIILVGITVFGLALGPYHQTLAMSAAFAGTLVLVMLFKPLKHRQQHHLQVFGYGCLYATTLAALTFMPSYDGTTPPVAYNISMGAVVLLLQLAFIGYAVLQLKRSITVEWSMGRMADGVLSLLSKAAPLLPAACVTYMSDMLKDYSSSKIAASGAKPGLVGQVKSTTPYTSLQYAGKNTSVP